MKRSEQLKIVLEAYAAIPDLQDGFFDVRERLYDMNLTAERRHRKGAPDSIRHGIPASTAAKLFTVSHLLDGWNQPDRFQVSDILNIRNEVLYAQAYAKRHQVELTGWANNWTERFKSVDYAELMK